MKRIFLILAILLIFTGCTGLNKPVFDNVKEDNKKASYEKIVKACESGEIEGLPFSIHSDLFPSLHKR